MSDTTPKKPGWQGILESLFAAGRFVIGLIFAGGFTYLVIQIGRGLERLDFSKVDLSTFDGTVIVVAIVTAAATIASSVASFYFATRRKEE